jgi:hypothetical protein
MLHAGGEKTPPKLVFLTKYSILLSLQRLFTTKLVYDNRKLETKANPRAALLFVQFEQYR